MDWGGIAVLKGTREIRVITRARATSKSLVELLSTRCRTFSNPHPSIQHPPYPIPQFHIPHSPSSIPHSPFRFVLHRCCERSIYTGLNQRSYTNLMYRLRISRTEISTGFNIFYYLLFLPFLFFLLFSFSIFLIRFLFFFSIF